MDFYDGTDENGNPLRTEVDLNLIDIVPEDDHPYLGYVFIKLNHPDDNQWCQSAECDRLLMIRQHLNERIQQDLEGMHSGVCMHEGWVELFFYLPDNRKFETLVRQVMSQHDQYSFETGNYRDAKWEHYLDVLYPDDKQFQQMENRHIIFELELEGDHLDLEREVEHYIGCQTSAQRERLINTLRGKSYELAELVEFDDDFQYGAILVKHHNVTESTMESETEFLIDETSKEHAVYKGWSTALYTGNTVE